LAFGFWLLAFGFWLLAFGFWSGYGEAMAANAFDYDLVVIGSGPAGQRAAIQGAKLDKKVAIIEKTAVVGGVSVNLGTIPSKTLREAALDLSGFRSREFYGASYTVKENITIQDLLVRTNQVIAHGIYIARHQLLRNHVELILGNASFIDPHTLKLEMTGGHTSQTITAGTIVIATAPRRRATRISPSMASASSRATTSCTSTNSRAASRSLAPG
jgi:pyruvate/2-oxoglutarate dehydrogenase complex dihydrolipoamide dehydrogenase (E3) component